jgi:putative transcriptional regulator
MGAKSEDETTFGDALLEGLREAVAWKRGEIALPVRNAPLHTAKWVKAIRKSVAKTSREFSLRFGIPVRTLEGWEQGRFGGEHMVDVKWCPGKDCDAFALSSC